MKNVAINRMGWLAVLAIGVGLFIWLRAFRQVNRPARETSRSLSVYAAASLTEAFTEVGKIYEKQNAGLRVDLNFAGSQQLALQIEQGGRADVFASADRRWMEEVQKRGLLLSEPQMFTRNFLVVILPRSNPGQINQLQDLARPGIKFILAADTVPVGRYGRTALEKLSRFSGFKPDYQSAVLKNVISNEENVKAVVGKVQLAEADAGIVYRSDITGAIADKLKMLEIPESANVVAIYPIAVLKTSPDTQAAKRFVQLVLSPEGQKVLSEHHFALVNAKP